MRRDFLKGALATLAAPALAAPLIRAAPAQVADPVNLSFATFNVGSSWYVYGTALSGPMQDALPPGSSIEVLAYQGGIGNPILVNRGDAQLGLSFSALSNWAAKGIIAFDEPLTEIRALIGDIATPHRLGIVVRRDAAIESVGDAADMPIRLVTTARGSAGEALARLSLESYGLTYEDVTAAGGRVTHIDLPVAIQQMRDGQADMLIHNVGYRHPAVLELSLGGGVTFIGLGEEQMAYIAENYGLQPGLSIPADEFEGVTVDIPSVGYPTSVIVNASVPEAVAHAITRAVCKNPEALHAAHPGLASFDPVNAADPLRNGNVPLHPGAERYYREAGLL